MATTDEIQKREKSRRVWRLNKKEGIPVMEALDSVGISKDVYYRQKNEHEDTWQNEITTAEGLEDKLQELQRKTERFEDTLSRYQEEAEEAQSKAAELTMEENWYQRVGDMQDKMLRIENILLDDDIDISQDLKHDLDELEEEAENLDIRLYEYRDEVEEVKEELEEIDTDADWYEKVEQIEGKMEKIEGLLQNEGLNLSDINTSLGELNDRTEQIEQKVEALNGEVSRLDERIDEIEDEQKQMNARLIEVEQRDLPESVFDLL